uniref:transposase n=1 Tax=Paenibacillus germinis TaxID=2654979 RepID=UPI001FE3C210|nr:transposase [Paenibacillus germinis]
MLTKVIIYAYTQRIYSSRQIAKAVRENLSSFLIETFLRTDFFNKDRILYRYWLKKSQC